MGVGSNGASKPRRQKTYKDSPNKSDGLKYRNYDDATKLDIDLKKIMFLLLQQKLFNESNNIYEKRNFCVVKDTLKFFEQHYYMSNIIGYFQSFLSKISLKQNIEWNKVINGLKTYCEPNLVKHQKNKEEIQHEIEYYKAKNIKYLNNFSLIESQFFSVFNEFLNPNEQVNSFDSKIGYIIHINSKEKNEKVPYILLNYYNREYDDIYFGISLDNNNFKVEYLFIVNPTIKVDYFIDLAIKNIENKPKINGKNVEYKINDDINMIYNLENVGKDDYIFNDKIYNKILYYFSINEQYNQFIQSFKNIENHTLKKSEIDIKHIEELIFNQKKILNENLVYLVDESIFKNVILDDNLYYFNYNLYKEKENYKDKTKLIEDIFDREDTKEDQRAKNEDKLDDIKKLLKCLKYEQLNSNKKISLISPEIYQKLMKESEINYNDIEVNLIKINKEFYIFFNKIKKFEKIINTENSQFSHDINKWSVVLTEKSNISESIIKKAFLIYQQRMEIKNNIYADKIIEKVNYTLINQNWFEKYNQHYKNYYIIKNVNNIKFGGNDNYDDFKKYLNSIDKTVFDNIKLKEEIGKFPDEFIKPELVVPKMMKYSSIEFPINFDIITQDLFQILMKEEDSNDKYNIEIKPEMLKKYRILLGSQLIILIDEKNNNILIYSIDKDNKKVYNPKYCLNFNELKFLQEQIISIQKMKNFEEYISQLGINIKNDLVQDIIYNNIIIGKFILLKTDALTIDSYELPPLIGLENVGATCYMNATLQCFSNIKLLTDYFFSNMNIIIKSKKKYTLADEYLKLILNLWNKSIDPKKKFYAPNDFKQRIGEKNPLFAGVAANDSKDLILFILEELHNDLNNPIPNQNQLINNNKIINALYEEFIQDYNSRNNSIIKDIFYGVQESTSICLNCKLKLDSYTIFNFLVFPLEKVRQYLIQNNICFSKVTLEHCLQHYISPENLTGQNKMYCNQCKGEFDAQTYNKIFKHPKVLIIILNRGKGIEFNVPFTYTMKLELDNIFINMENNPNFEGVDKNKKVEYELISVITHMGESSMAGHFIACAKSPVDNDWYLYNDAQVSKCDDPLNIFGESATLSIPYVLFYKLIE